MSGIIRVVRSLFITIYSPILVTFLYNLAYKALALYFCLNNISVALTLYLRQYFRWVIVITRVMTHEYFVFECIDSFVDL